MDLESKIKYCTDLTPSEVQFSQYILTNRRKVIGSAMQDIIKDAFVSKSLVHRFCKKLGLSDRYYYLKKEMLQHSLDEFKTGETRAEQVKAVEHALFELYRDTKLHVKPEELEKRGGAYYSDVACECISAIYNNKRQPMVVSTVNCGSIPCLPEDTIVEVSSLISAKGAEPLAWGEMKAHERGWLQMMKAMEECTIEAAIKGDYGLAYEAFNLNPLVENGAAAEQVLNELLVAHEKYLPQFADTVAKLKAQGVQPQDKTVQKLLAEGK
ncbi:hypothetical protein P22_3935 [Propionispora sp. 2/2-37]|uniref:family 4 glycosyl hydrolase n=1 Tax=Propionispora sp. 2/2-37 TaxID=1677858 RepID=UPI0006BB6D2B|nr:hypothetical protein [Propionispora sp. 2/2-37]CUH97789.1 hypothetical protein P22_3935 [Propionispora sp. 2/2-37]